MASTEPTTKPDVDDGTGKKRRRKRHILKLKPDGTPSDECLCGYLWDVFPVPLPKPGDEACGECVRIYKDRARRGAL